MWDVWFLGQIEYSTVERLWIINEILKKIVVSFKFLFSEKATKIWKNLPLVLRLLSKYSCFVKTGLRFFQVFWPSHHVLTLKKSPREVIEGKKSKTCGCKKSSKYAFYSKEAWHALQKVSELSCEESFVSVTISIKNYLTKYGFVSKLVYTFWPAKTLCTYQDIFHSFKHHIGSGQHQKSRGKSAKP